MLSRSVRVFILSFTTLLSAAGLLLTPTTGTATTTLRHVAKHQDDGYRDSLPERMKRLLRRLGLASFADTMSPPRP